MKLKYKVSLIFIVFISLNFNVSPKINTDIIIKSYLGRNYPPSGFIKQTICVKAIVMSKINIAMYGDTINIVIDNPEFLNDLPLSHNLLYRVNLSRLHKENKYCFEKKYTYKASNISLYLGGSKGR